MNNPSRPTRRSFIKHLAVAGSLGAMARSTLGNMPSGISSPAGTGDWVEAVRSEFPALHESAGYFQTGAFGPCTRSVIERNKALLELQNLGPAHPKYLNVMKEAEASCRPLIAAALCADESEVALTQSTTA